jgi:hypothetical protein
MTDEEWKNDPFRLGGRARVAGEQMEANPHERIDAKWPRWADGWLDMDRHLTERDEALASIGWHR